MTEFSKKKLPFPAKTISGCILLCLKIAAQVSDSRSAVEMKSAVSWHCQHSQGSRSALLPILPQGAWVHHGLGSNRGMCAGRPSATNQSLQGPSSWKCSLDGLARFIMAEKNPAPCWALGLVKQSVWSSVITLRHWDDTSQERRLPGLSVAVLHGDWGELAGLQAPGSTTRAQAHLALCICVHCPAKTHQCSQGHLLTHTGEHHKNSYLNMLVLPHKVALGYPCCDW